MAFRDAGGGLSVRFSGRMEGRCSPQPALSGNSVLLKNWIISQQDLKTKAHFAKPFFPLDNRSIFTKN